MAVVSQPFDRSATCPPPDEPDDELNEFWENDPWSIAFKHNLSGFEENRTFINLGAGRFRDISYFTQADSKGDGRSVVAADFTGDGRQDLLVRQAGGGPLKLYENRFPRRQFLKLTLRGEESNRLGIGSRITAIVGDRKIVRELYPVNTFHSQAAATVHLGLGKADEVDALVVRWPNGKVQEFKNLAANRHLLIHERNGIVEDLGG